jgi:hypothetical protein
LIIRETSRDIRKMGVSRPTKKFHSSLKDHPWHKEGQEEAPNQTGGFESALDFEGQHMRDIRACAKRVNIRPKHHSLVFGTCKRMRHSRVLVELYGVRHYRNGCFMGLFPAIPIHVTCRCRGVASIEAEASSVFADL